MLIFRDIYNTFTPNIPRNNPGYLSIIHIDILLLQIKRNYFCYVRFKFLKAKCLPLFACWQFNVALDFLAFHIFWPNVLILKSFPSDFSLYQYNIMFLAIIYLINHINGHICTYWKIYDKKDKKYVYPL